MQFVHTFPFITMILMSPFCSSTIHHPLSKFFHPWIKWKVLRFFCWEIFSFSRDRPSSWRKFAPTPGEKVRMRVAFRSDIKYPTPITIGLLFHILFHFVFHFRNLSTRNAFINALSLLSFIYSIICL